MIATPRTLLSRIPHGAAFNERRQCELLAALSYLLVYLARPELPGAHWWQRTNDPELRGGDMTWGICRPNVRGIGDIVGANLFFVACDPQRPLHDRYHLAAYLRVGEAISHTHALERYPGRANVLLDHLPPGRTLEDRLQAYVTMNMGRLRWWAEVRKSHRTSDLRRIREDAAEYIVTIGAVDYVHAWWDHHSRIGRYKTQGRTVLQPVWRHAFTKPYLVADPDVSRQLTHAIPYTQIGVGLALDLPTVSDLRNDANRHPYRRIKDAATVRALVDIFAAQESSVRASTRPVRLRARNVKRLGQGFTACGA